MLIASMSYNVLISTLCKRLSQLLEPTLARPLGRCALLAILVPAAVILLHEDVGQHAEAQWTSLQCI